MFDNLKSSSSSSGFENWGFLTQIPDNGKTGEIRENTNGTKMKIIKYIRSDNIFVEFQDECKYIVNCQYKEWLFLI